MRITEKSCLRKGTIISLVYHSVCLFVFFSPPFVSWWRSGGCKKTALLYLLSHDHQIRVCFFVFFFDKHIYALIFFPQPEGEFRKWEGGWQAIKVTCEYSPHSSQ